MQTKQNSLIKYLTKKEFLYPTNLIHQENKILKINDVYEQKLILFAYDCLNKKTIPLFHEYFQFNTPNHEYPTTQINLLKVPQTNKTIGETAIRCKAAAIWNKKNIPKDYLKLSKNTVKKRIFHNFLTTYQ